MREIGLIKHVQLQRSSLKQGQRPHRYYDPAPLLLVERLRLAPGGVSGLSADGLPIIDVHHANHPETKNSLGMNGISIGFTSHYRAMRDQYGAHLSAGLLDLARPLVREPDPAPAADPPARIRWNVADDDGPSPYKG